MLPPIQEGQKRCPQRYFRGRLECGQGMASNGWGCERCIAYHYLGVRNKSLASFGRARLVGKLDSKSYVRVKYWLEGLHGDKSQVLGELYNAPITQDKFSCLRNGKWINDEILNGTMRLLFDKHSQWANNFLQVRKCPKMDQALAR